MRHALRTCSGSRSGSGTSLRRRRRGNARTGFLQLTRFVLLKRATLVEELVLRPSWEVLDVILQVVGRGQSLSADRRLEGSPGAAETARAADDRDQGRCAETQPRSIRKLQGFHARLRFSASPRRHSGTLRTPPRREPLPF